MAAAPSSFPHPVLGVSDDISGSVLVDLNVERVGQAKALRIVFETLIVDNSYFNFLIQSGKAKIAAKVYCGSTMKTWMFSDCLSGFDIPEDSIANKIEIEVYIIATENISNYFDETFNADYGGQIFAVSKRDIIGVLGKTVIPINKKFEKLGLGNIFKFVPNDDPRSPVSFDLTSDKITINYPVDRDGSHPPTALFHVAPWTAYNIFILPALAKAFDLKSGEQANEVEGLDWSLTLDAMLPNSEWGNDGYINAQKILGFDMPLIQAYKEAQNIKK
jgi:hypothetical protein